MGEVVNLRRERKRAQRRAAEAVAGENRIAHGVSKPDRAAARLLAAGAKRGLDGHRLSGDDVIPAGGHGPDPAS